MTRDRSRDDDPDPTDTARINVNMVRGVDVVGDMSPDQMGYWPFAGWSTTARRSMVSTCAAASPSAAASMPAQGTTRRP
jgi:hypothetical protein